MNKKFPIHPAKPERLCWGCDQYCSIDAMACSNERSPHPVELFGPDWLEWGDNNLCAKDEPVTAPATVGPDFTGQSD
ncbi:MAG: DUF3079 domain-containing protein [Gammaproteobacteria bacterium]|uniref:DUF3079 domain-containing protein n=1 Tax=Rhodoferax sp. TaxID=50421 RepID=UPI00179AE0A1|nr:DUF3079 domain-containing protein [Rhodoferax sp.]MBU3899906.1 DUF3079 domain-containing protein [Gammaproteobacteria bacterium]MBA3057863.1 DUF3079 domain-containing protein [Rhodoferax sp.]MBU3996090.1 DUF3079 domain-containing protein [Gammaproteobacteria bacterium]MBU4019172.1 DUF3079 domain-containing protein [Gammaproteobacteria bacterium]MBU4078890.1 DUF3079 domain-containing protein [Gammaproteobacteria bacterium]